MSWIIIVCSVLGTVGGFLFGYSSARKKVKAQIDKQSAEIEKQLEQIKQNVSDPEKDKINKEVKAE